MASGVPSTKDFIVKDKPDWEIDSSISLDLAEYFLFVFQYKAFDCFRKLHDVLLRQPLRYKILTYGTFSL